MGKQREMNQMLEPVGTPGLGAEVYLCLGATKFFEQILGGNEGQGRLGCCSPRGHKESDTTEQLMDKILRKPSFTLACSGNEIEWSCSNLSSSRDGRHGDLAPTLLLLPLPFF